MKQFNKNRGTGFGQWVRTSALLKTIFAAIPMVWFNIIIGIFGERIGFADSYGAITEIGKNVTYFVYGFVILLMALWNVDSRSIIINDKKSIEVLESLCQTIRETERRKRDHIKRAFVQFVSNRKKIEIDYRADREINDVLVSLVDHFSTISDLDKSDISATLFYCFPDRQRNWRSLDENYCAAFGGVQETMTSPDSFAHFVLNGKYDFYYFNDKHKEGVRRKKDGMRKSAYRLNDRDKEAYERTKGYGSILGYKFNVDIDKKVYIRSLLCVSTYGKKLDSSVGEKYRKMLEKKIRQIILPSFITCLEAELMQLYIQDTQN